MRYNHVVEIGAGDSASSRGLPMMTHADKVTLYEPNSILWKELNHAAAGMDNVSVVNAAVSDGSEFVRLYHVGYASYVEKSPSFLGTSIESEGAQFLFPLLREVRAVSVGVAIPSDVDYLILTANGSEYEILLGMKTRPAIIRTKHYCHAAQHWFVYNQIEGWMKANGYVGRLLESNQHQTFLHIEWKR